MDTFINCPKCRKSRSCIRYGKFKLGNENFARRIRCKKCGRTSIIFYRHRFFDRMHISPEVFHHAIELYISGDTIKDISIQLKKRPNTIIDWVKKVKCRKNLYRDYLRSCRDFTESEISSLLYSFKERAVKRRYVSKNKLGMPTLPTYRRGTKPMLRY